MKKILLHISIVLLFLTNQAFSQCNAIFIFSYGPNGQVTFSSTSTGTLPTTTYTWNFGNATFTNGVNLINTVSTYTANGTYTVTLSINSPTVCNSSTSAIVTITNVCNLNANFIYSEGTLGLVNFTNTSTGTVAGVSYTWDYGDGSSSLGIAPPHTYSANGAYQALLYANNNVMPACVDSSTITVNVTSYCTIASNFTWTAFSNTLNFLSTSTGTQAGNMYNWSFGDGGTSVLINPVHSYTNPGVYNVTLVVSNGTVPVCSNTIVQSVTVQVCSLASAFVHTVETGGNVQFADNSAGTNDLTVTYWDFGDGAGAVGSSVNHIYSNAGAYIVTMIDDNGGGCIDSIKQSVNVTGIACTADAGFKIVPTATAQYWYAIPDYPWNVSAAKWTWGDLSSSNTLYASHNYAIAGNYSVCLTVTTSCGSTGSWCITKYLNRGEDASQMVFINVMPPGTPEGVEERPVENAALMLFPNPASNEINFMMIENETAELTIYDIRGQKVLHELVSGSGLHQAKLNSFDPGLYLFSLKTAGRQYQSKLVLEK